MNIYCDTALKAREGAPHEAMIPALFVATLLQPPMRRAPAATLRRHPTIEQLSMSTAYVSIPFRGVNVGDAVRLIHSPEQWAAGACLFGGLQTFIIYAVTPPEVYGNEHTVSFRAMGHLVRLFATHKRACHITVTAGGAEVRYSYSKSPPLVPPPLQLLGCPPLQLCDCYRKTEGGF